MPRMKNNVIGQIDHSECSHGKSSQEYKRCREQKVAEAQATNDAVVNAGRTLLRREAEASTALDGETYSVEGEPQPHVSNGMLTYESLTTLREIIDDVSDQLSKWGDVLTAEVQVETDGLGVITVVCNEDGWGVRA